jgi:hypothetical protein
VNPRNFFAELKRRNVYKVGAAYLMAAWLFILALIFLPASMRVAW